MSRLHSASIRGDSLSGPGPATPVQMLMLVMVGADGAHQHSFGWQWSVATLSLHMHAVYCTILSLKADKPPCADLHQNSFPLGLHIFQTCQGQGWYCSSGTATTIRALTDFVLSSSSSPIPSNIVLPEADVEPTPTEAPSCFTFRTHAVLQVLLHSPLPLPPQCLLIG